MPPDISELWTHEIRRLPTSRGVEPDCAGDQTSVYVMCHGDADQEAEVLALDRVSGKERWRFAVHEVDEPAGIGKWHPQVAASGGLVFQTLGRVVCVDARAGTLRWSVERGYAPTVHGERVYLLHHSTRVRVLDARDGSVVLDRDVGRWVAGPNRGNQLTGYPAVSETHIFSVDEAGGIWGFERETGGAAWHSIPEGSTGFLGNAQPVIANGRLYAATFSMDRNRPQSLYCFEQVDEAEAGKQRAGISVAGPDEAQRDWGSLEFQIVERLEGRTLADRAPYHKPGRGWTMFRCRLSESGAEFVFGEKAGRKTELGTFGQSILCAASAKDGDALLKVFRRAFGLRKPTGEGKGRRIRTPAVLNSFSLQASDVPELRKWTSLDGSVELLVAWDPAEKRGAFLEKDELHRKGVVELIASLVAR